MMFDRKAEGRYWDFGWQLIEGCTRIADGCKHCWSLDKERRFRKETGVVCHEERLDRPLKRKKPASYAIWNDLFHKDVPQLFIVQTLNVTGQCPQHTFLILTKRPQIAARVMKAYYGIFEHCGEPKPTMPYPNVWLGTSCSTQADADKNIPILLQIPATVHTVSFEPLLEGIDLAGKNKQRMGKTGYLRNYFSPWFCADCAHHIVRPASNVAQTCEHCGSNRYNERDRSIGWVIIGAESGPKPRPCKIEHVRSLVEQCKAVGVPVFVKQLHINGKVSKNPEEWPEDLRVREYPV